MLIYERDNFTCQMCWEKGGRLNSHHIIPYNDSKKLRFEVTNGITLCIKCHRKIKNKEYQYVQFFKDNLAKRVNSGKIPRGQS